MRFPSCAWYALLAGGCLALPAGAALPLEVTVTAPAKLELMRGDRIAGSIGLPVGERLELIDVTGDFALVRYRSLNGRVAVAQTDLSKAEAPPPPPPAVAPVAPAAPPPPAIAAPTARAPVKVMPAHAPANALERALAGKLVTCEGGALQPFDGARLAGVKFYALYFSASWCAPCRAFTPGFVDAYGKIRALFPEFEVVLVNFDHSPGKMLAYMRDDHMAWPALRWDAIKGAADITHYGGDGIPCLVLVDENGKVLSDSYRWWHYVGPDAVLEDTWKILRDYRRQNPRVKA